MFNQVASGINSAIQLGNATIVRNPALGFSPRIVPLDSALGRSLGGRGRGGSIGARVSRVLTSRLSAELTLDYGFAPLKMTQANIDAIEATRASFLEAFDRLTSGISNFTPMGVTSTVALEKAGGHQLFTSGAVNINLRTTGTVIPYATVGAGLIARTGKTLGARLTGNYQMVTGMGAPLNETDNVTVRDARDTRTFAGVLGGGVKYCLSRRWGIRFDIRAALGKNTASTVLDASPNVALGALPAQAIAIAVDPTILFSNTSATLTLGGVTGVRTSSLGGPITGLRTFSGSGVSSHTNIVTGVFWRF